LQLKYQFHHTHKGSHEDAERFFLRSSKCTELHQAAEEAAAVEPARSMTRHIRHGSNKDVLQLLRQADNDFRERARSEIDLVSSPTLKVNSDEVMVPDRKGKEKEKEREKEKTSRRSLSYGEKEGEGDIAGGSVEVGEKGLQGHPIIGVPEGEVDQQYKKEKEPSRSDREGSDEDGYENDGCVSEEEDAEEGLEDGYEGLETYGGAEDEDEHGGEADSFEATLTTTTTVTTGHMYSDWGVPDSRDGEEREKVRE